MSGQGRGEYGSSAIFSWGEGGIVESVIFWQLRCLRRWPRGLFLIVLIQLVSACGTGGECGAEEEPREGDREGQVKSANIASTSGSRDNSGPLNSYERSAFNLTNEERAAFGLRGLVWDEELGDVAKRYSIDMCERGFFDHIDPDGKDPAQRIRASGLTFQYAGENIAKGYLDGATVMNAWMNSEGHRQNILEERFVYLGLGYIECDGKPIWTQLFLR